MSQFTNPTPTNGRASLRKATCLRAARFGFPAVPVGWRNSPPNYWLFPDVMMIRSMPSPRASHGVATDEARSLADSSKGFFTEAGYRVGYNFSEGTGGNGN